MRPASMRTSSVGPSSAITTRIALDPASIAPSLARGAPTQFKLSLLRERGTQSFSVDPLAQRLGARSLLRRCFAFTAAGAHRRHRGARCLGNLDLVGLGDSREDLDLDAVGDAEL